MLVGARAHRRRWRTNVPTPTRQYASEGHAEQPFRLYRFEHIAREAAEPFVPPYPTRNRGGPYGSRSLVTCSNLDHLGG
jgi:hypothetical protein